MNTADENNHKFTELSNFSSDKTRMMVDISVDLVVSFSAKFAYTSLISHLTFKF